MQRVMTKALSLFGVFWLLLNESLNIYFFCLQGLKTDAIKAQLFDRNAFRGKLFSHQAFCKQVAKLHPGQAAVITNGRVGVLFFCVLFYFCFIYGEGHLFYTFVNHKKKCLVSNCGWFCDLCCLFGDLMFTCHTMFIMGSFTVWLSFLKLINNSSTEVKTKEITTVKEVWIPGLN